MVVWSFVRLFAGDSSDVTLAFEEPQVIPPFSRKETKKHMIHMIQMIQMIQMV